MQQVFCCFLVQGRYWPSLKKNYTVSQPSVYRVIYVYLPFMYNICLTLNSYKITSGPHLKCLFKIIILLKILPKCKE